MGQFWADVNMLVNGLSPEQMVLTRRGDDLVISFADGDERLVLTGWLAGNSTVNTIKFCGGPEFDRTVLLEQLGPEVLLAQDDHAQVQEDGVTSVAGNVIGNDSANAHVVTNAGIHVGSFGTLNLLADGSYTYVLSNDSAAIQTLSDGMSLQEQFVYVVSDGAANPQFAEATLTIDILGNNDAPMAQDDTMEVVEDSASPVVGNALGNDGDIDQDDVLGVATAGVYTGLYGTLEIDAEGRMRYALNNELDIVQALPEGEELTDTFAYVASDGLAQAGASVVVHIFGRNDVLIVNGDGALAQEDVLLSASGNVLANDQDVDAGTVLTVVNPATSTGSYGTLTLAANGDYSYVLDNPSAAVQSLAAWESVTESFDYMASDGYVTQAGTLTVSVAGSNDAPIVVTAMDAQAGRVGENFVMQFAADAFQDIDHGDVLSYTASLANGDDLPSWLSFDPASRQFLGTPLAGDVGALEIRVTARDILGASAAQNFVLTVSNRNGAPETVADVASVSEDSILTATGNVLGNDLDPDNDPIIVEGPLVVTTEYGQMTLNGDGSYRYDLYNDALTVQTLGLGEVVLEEYAYSASDGTLAAPGRLTVSIAGANDIPVLVSPLADHEVTAQDDFAWRIPAGSFTDIDRTDTLSYTATLANGAALPTWLSFDAASQTFSGEAPAAAQSLEVRVTATDGHGQTSYASDVFSLRIVANGDCGKGNEGVGNGEDPPPPGHDHNWNDGPGTSPGHPGRGGHKDDDHDNPGHGGGKEKDNDKGQCLDLDNVAKHCADFDEKNRQGSQNSDSHGASKDKDVAECWDRVHRAGNEDRNKRQKGGAVDCDDFGDSRELAKATQGYLGSRQAYGRDGLSLDAGCGTNLQGFHGIQEGVRRL